jgi:hypothetical protein
MERLSARTINAQYARQGTQETFSASEPSRVKEAILRQWRSAYKKAWNFNEKALVAGKAWSLRTAVNFVPLRHSSVVQTSRPPFAILSEGISIGFQGATMGSRDRVSTRESPYRVLCGRCTCGRGFRDPPAHDYSAREHAIPAKRRRLSFRRSLEQNGNKCGRSQATTAESEPFKVAFLRLFERRTTPR